MSILLVIGLAIGLILLGRLKGNIVGWKRIHIRIALLVLSLYGFIPAIIMKLGLVEITSWRVVVAIAYF